MSESVTYSFVLQVKYVQYCAQSSRVSTVSEVECAIKLKST